jgi:hypothetical protein
MEPTKLQYINQLRIYRDTLDLIKCLKPAITKVVDLLGSKNISDVLEAIRFLEVATACRLDPEEVTTSTKFVLIFHQRGVRRALALIWSKEEKVREAVMSCYASLYLSPKEDWKESKQLLYMADNLVK